MLVQTFEDAQASATDLNPRASRWQTALNDGFHDLVNDVDYDVRDRLRSVARAPELLIDGSQTSLWETLSQWLADAFAEAIADSFAGGPRATAHVATTVAEFFPPRERDPAPGDPLDRHERHADLGGRHRPDPDIPHAGAQKLIGAMRGSYSGILMAGIITTLAGMALINPLSVLAGAVLGESR